MPKTLWWLGYMCTVLVFIGFCFSNIAFVTVNTPLECHLNRTISYTIRYVGFFLFDYLQIKKVIAISTPISTAKLYCVYFVTCLRITSYLYNSIWVSGAVHIPVENGNGACHTIFADYMVWQEHGISILFEFVLFLLIGWDIYQKSYNYHNFEMMRKLIDFEIFTFLVYYIVEIIYMVTFFMLSKDNVSIYNIFYLNVPVFLFFCNLIHVLMKRKKSKKVVNITPKKEPSLTKQKSIPNVFDNSKQPHW
ncbi:hypothetical protein HDV04_002183 [Boothiomyces sp. JEL0838]|nr:hypothetical protein HDV04_002183 [Boothiomyces sp. JEL0838]